MLYPIASGSGCFYPILPFFCYGTDSTEEGETVPSLELISKEKNVFGDMYYYIRDSNGVTNRVYEADVDAFLKKNGATELRRGRAYRYPKKRSMER
jgi:hypothetical protein